MEDIRSAHDPRLAGYARVGDPAWLRSQGLFAAEGRLVVERLIETGRFAIDSILVTQAAARALGARLDSAGVAVLVCSADIMHRVTGFNFHRGCLALARREAPPAIDSWLDRKGVLVVLEGVGNPDNVGGLFRSAAAFGACGILIGPSTADPLYRKALRTSMGAVLQVPWSLAEPWPEVLTTLRSRGWRVAAMTPHPDAIPIDRFAMGRHRRVALLLGAEGSGLSDAALTAADDRVCIPIATAVDSLNVAVAAGIALHVITRWGVDT
jgi:tRNA G18 (ribose-2'-O)-methylase SpoU